jgi:di/tricarboxylate transporter
LDWQAWFTLAVIGVVFAGLARAVAPADVLLLGGTVVVTLAGVIQPVDALRGFANEGMLTVAALFVVAGGLRETGALDRLAALMLSSARGERGALARLSLSLPPLSAFLNNTTVVAMLMPLIADWCRRNRLSPSRLMMPLSFLTILGGTCTLIGTSTNLVVNGLMTRAGGTTHGALRPIGLFELAWVGVPLAALGVAYMFTIGRRLLPDRRDLLESFDERTREYLANLRIEPGCPLAGQTVEQAGLRRLPGLFLIEIVRAERIIAPVGPTELLVVGDRLTFTGAVATIVDLQRTRGLVHDPHDEPRESAPHTIAQRAQRNFVEAVVSSTSPIIGRSIRDADFRALYNAAVLAVHRGGERLAGRVGDIVVRAGDTLLLQTGPHFERAHRDHSDFYLVGGLPGAWPVRHERAAVSLLLLALLIGLTASGVLPIVLAAFVAAGLMVATRCLSATEARRSVHWDVLVAIAASFGLSAALEQSGAAGAIAGQLVAGAHGLSVACGVTGRGAALVALAAVYVMTMLLSELLTNNAAAALAFPLAMSAAEQVGADPRPFAMGVVFAASLCFATPIGYQTHMMVSGPGGYRFGDFVRVGLPFDLLLAVGALALIPVVWPL